jgi:hypothetical protein
MGGACKGSVSENVGNFFVLARTIVQYTALSEIFRLSNHEKHYVGHEAPCMFNSLQTINENRVTCEFGCVFFFFLGECKFCSAAVMPRDGRVTKAATWQQANVKCVMYRKCLTYHLS